MVMKMPEQKEHCPMQVSLAVMGGKWKPYIAMHLLSGSKRFGELRRLIPDATQQVLTTQLRELEEAGVITRKVYPEVPPRVEYTLTSIGRQLEPLLHHLLAWGESYCDDQDMPHRVVSPHYRPQAV